MKLDGTPSERAALEWLKSWLDSPSFPAGCHRDTILAILSRPVMPEEPTREVTDLMWKAATDCGHSGTRYMAAAYRALYAHLTAPKTKTVEVWRVEYAWRDSDGGWHPVSAQYESEGMTRSHAGSLGNNATCIRVTGPHSQEVPA